MGSIAKPVIRSESCKSLIIASLYSPFMFAHADHQVTREINASEPGTLIPVRFFGQMPEEIHHT